MDRIKNMKTLEIQEVVFGEKTKYVMPVDEFDVQFMQLNYNKYRVRNNEGVVPVWSVQRNTLDNSYCEFEIVAGSDENAESYGNNKSAGETTNQSSTYKDNKIVNTFRKLDEEIDFATYLKIVNVFKESDTAIAGSVKDVIIDQEQSILGDKNTLKSETPFVTLCVPSGEKIKVALSNFHGFWTSGDGVQCRVCLVMVEDVEAHKMEVRHMKRIASTINNVHCVRKIGPILNHCVLCNEIIENIEFHLKTNADHTKHLEKALQSIVPEIANGKPINADAEKLKNFMIDTAHTKQLTYIKALNHETSYNVCPTSVDNTENRDFERTPEIQPINNPRQTKAHVQGNHHKAQLFMMKNKESISTSNGSNELAYCKFCDKQMHINNLKSHKKGKHHKAMLEWQAKHKVSSTSKPKSSGFRHDDNYRYDDSFGYDVGYTLNYGYGNGYDYNYGYAYDYGYDYDYGYQLGGLNYYNQYYY